MKYLPSVKPKLALKLKMLRIYLNLAYLIFEICQFPFKFKKKYIFFKYSQLVRPKLVPKLKMLRIYWKFGTFDISNIPISILMLEIIFIKYFYQTSIKSEHCLFGPTGVQLLVNIWEKIIFEINIEIGLVERSINPENF